MADHKLNIVINRTMETGKWVAKVIVDDKRNQTTLIFSQRKDEFSPIQWLIDRANGLISATSLSKSYLRALNFYPEHAFGSKPGFLNIRKRVTQRSIDEKFSSASKDLHVSKAINGPTGAPFAAKTKQFSAVKVTIDDRFQASKAKNDAITAIFSELEAQGQPLTRGNQNYYRGLLDLSFTIEESGGEIAAESDTELRSALGVLKNFRQQLEKSTNTAVRAQVDQLTDALTKKIYPEHPQASDPALNAFPQSSPEVYGRRPEKPAHLQTTKNKTPGP